MDKKVIYEWKEIEGYLENICLWVLNDLDCIILENFPCLGYFLMNEHLWNEMVLKKKTLIYNQFIDDYNEM